MPPTQQHIPNSILGLLEEKITDSESSYRRHVEINGDVVSWLRRKFANKRWGMGGGPARRRTAAGISLFISNYNEKIESIKKLVLFNSDIIKQLLESPDVDNDTLHLLGKLSETHEERIEITSLRRERQYMTNKQSLILSAIGKVAGDSLHGQNNDNRRITSATATSNNGLRTRRSRLQQHWLWVLNNHIFYISNNDLTQQLKLPSKIVGCLTDDAINCSDFEKQMAIQIIQRIAMRGGILIQSYLNPVIGEVVDYCTCLIDRSRNRRLTMLVYQSCVTIASLSHLYNNPEYVIPAVRYMKQFGKGMNIISRVATMSLSVETPSRKHLEDCGLMRPGESLSYYIILCHSSVCGDIRYVGRIALAVILDTLCQNNTFDFHNKFNPNYNDTISSQLYTKRAIEILQTYENNSNNNNSELGDNNVTPMENRYMIEDEEEKVRDVNRMLLRGFRPCSILADCVLRCDTTKNDVWGKGPNGIIHHEMAELGHFLKQMLPLHILQQAVWCPNLHRYFDKKNQNIVLCLLLISRRTQHDSCNRILPTLPFEILMTHILPFACCYSKCDDNLANKCEASNNVERIELRKIFEM